MSDPAAADAPAAHTDLSAADLRDWILDYVTTEVNDPDAHRGRGGWIDKDSVKWAAATVFGVTTGRGGCGYVQTDRDRLDGRIDRAVKRLADDEALVAATKANPPPGLPDGPVDVDTGRRRYVNGTLLTTPELLADAIAAKRAADRRDRAAVDRATTLAQAVADALGIDTPPRATATRDGNVRLELTTAQIDAILGED